MGNTVSAAHASQVDILRGCPKRSEDFIGNVVSDREERKDTTSTVVDENDCQRRTHITCIKEKINRKL
jgi:hypothetical protein